MDLREMFKKMGSGEMKAHSELGTRDEAKQTRNFGTRIQKMKTVTGINARALVMKDVVVPFNPFTGAADDNYNRKTPFRPILLVSQTIAGIKQACKENPELEKFWREEQGVTFDLSKEEATMEEYNAFKSRGYIKPRVMSYATVAMNFSGNYGFPEFRVKYTVPPEDLNEEGTYDYDSAPVWHMAAVFFNGLLKPEADEKKKKLEAQAQSKETIANERRSIFSKSPVGFVSPSNLIPFFYFPLADVPPTYDPKHPKDVEKAIRFYSYTDKWTVPLNDAFGNPMFDTDMDFFDFNIKTPSSKDTKPSGAVYTDDDSMELYTAMQISNTDGRLALHGGSTIVDGTAKKNEEVYASFVATVKEYFLESQEQSSMEGGETFEKIMAASNRFRPITQAMDNFLEACNDVFNTNFAVSPYCIDSFKKANAKFLTAMNADNAMMLAAADDDELEAEAENQKSSVKEMIEELGGGIKASEDPQALDIGMGGADILDEV